MPTDGHELDLPTEWAEVMPARLLADALVGVWLAARKIREDGDDS